MASILNSQNNQITEIGLIRLSALGDIVWTTPLLKSLKESFPHARITFFVGKGHACLFSGLDPINLVEMEKPRTLGDYRRLAKQLGAFQFDAFLCCQASLRINPLYFFVKAKRRIGWDSLRGRDGHRFFVSESIPFQKEHSVEAFLGFARMLKASRISKDPTLEEDPQSRSWRESELPKKYLVYHHWASSEQRSLPLATAKKMLDWLKKKYQLPILLTGTQDDNERLSSLIAEGIVSYAGRTSLVQLQSLLAGAELFIGPDSGPIHLANAMGTKTLGLYAAVPATYTGPYGQVDRCIDVYPQAVEKFMGRSVEKVNWRTRVYADNLMDLIDFDRLTHKIEEILG